MKKFKEENLYFNILKSLVSSAYNDLIELDDITIYRFGILMGVDIDDIDEDEYENFVEKCIITCQKLKKFLDTSENKFNKGMILFE